MGGALFPVMMKDADFRPPEGASTYYVVAGNGLFLERRTPLFAASVPVAGVPGLALHDAALRLRFPRLPRALVERVLGFFRTVYDRWQGEAIVVLFYAPEGRRGGRFALRVPRQKIRGRLERGRFRADLRVEYEACPRPAPHFVALATIHSHAELGPAHSMIDEHDELYEPGLHITAGRLHTSTPEFAAAFVVGRTRFTVPPGLVLPPVRRFRRPPDAWLRRVTVICEPPGAMPALAAWCDRHHGDAGAAG